MVQEQNVQVDGKLYGVTISDENPALLAAKAAGRVVVGLLHAEGECHLTAAEYLIEEMETADAGYLERVVRRSLGLPWQIGESERILIREFCVEDACRVRKESQDSRSDSLFYTPDALFAYIRNQYRFYEYGIWAIVRKSDGTILGKAGISDCDRNRFRTGSRGSHMDTDMQLELGYHIFEPYRRRGYAKEACRIILDYVKQEFDCPVYAVTDPANCASIKVLERLGFCVIEQKYNETEQQNYQYVWNCS